MFPNRSTASNDNIDGKFVTKSTPKKPQNNNNDNCDRKLSNDVIYSELQFLKEENLKSINEMNNRLDKLEINIDDSLFGKSDNYRADEERKKASLKELEKRVDNCEKNSKKMENSLAALTKQMAAMQNELIAIKTRESKFSMEDLAKRCVSDYSNIVTDSLDRHMGKFTAMLSEMSLKMNKGDEMRPSLTVPSKEADVNNFPSAITNSAASNNVNPKQTEQKSNNNLVKAPENTSNNSAPLKNSPKAPVVNNNIENKAIKEPINLFPSSTSKDRTDSPGLFGSLKPNSNQGSNSLFTGLPNSGLFGGKSSFASPVNDNKSKDSEKPTTNSIFGNKPLFSIDPKNSTKVNLFKDSEKPATNSIFDKPLLSFDSSSSSKPVFGSNLFNQSNESPFGKQQNLFNIETVKPANEIQSEKIPIFGAGSDCPSFDSLSTVAQNSGDSSAFPIDSTASQNTWKPGNKLFASYSDNTANSTPANDESGEVQNAEEEHDVHFQPIIELPPLVAVEKDEDSSDVLFKSRVKLYKYTDGEWKERGVGEMKVLQAKASVDPSKPVRLLMRRDQVRKICCNQRVTKSVPTFTEMGNEKSVCWIGNDFSDGSSVTERFAIRFSSVELLKQFKDIIKNVQDAITEQ